MRTDREDRTRTLIRRGEFVAQHGVDDRLDIGRMRTAGAVVHLGFGGDVVRGVARLKDAQRSSHISL